MPAQTALENIYFPDGTQLLAKADGDSVYSDVGVIEGDATATFNFDVNKVQTGNAGDTVAQYKNMTVDAGFTLNSLNPTMIAKLGGGLFTVTTTAGTPLATIPDQVIAAGWADDTAYDLVLETSSTDSTRLRTSVKPVFTAITLDLGGTPEVLVEGTEYVIVEDTSSYSGWAISFISGNMSTGSPTTFAITVEYGTNTPIASTVMTAGTTTQVSTPFEFKYVHTDSDGLIRSFYMPRVEAQSGGFAFNFKGANSDGLENMPVTLQGSIDTTKTDGAQLFTWTIEAGAA